MEKDHLKVCKLLCKHKFRINNQNITFYKIFPESNTGKFLEKYGVLKEAVLVVDAVTNMLKYVREYATVLFRSIYEGVRPVLQSIGAKIQQYIPQLTEYLTIIGNFMADSFMKFVNFLQTNVFV